MNHQNHGPQGITNQFSSVSQCAALSPSFYANNSIYILFKSTFIMKNIVSLMMALCCSFSVGWAQLGPLSSTGYSTEAPLGYWLELESVTSHTGGILDGQSTYRLYLNTLNANDYLSSCSGDQDNVLILNSSNGTWYNDIYNTGWNAQGINPLFLPAFPDLAVSTAAPSCKLARLFFHMRLFDSFCCFSFSAMAPRARSESPAAAIS